MPFRSEPNEATPNRTKHSRARHIEPQDRLTPCSSSITRRFCAYCASSTTVRPVFLKPNAYTCLESAGNEIIRGMLHLEEVLQRLYDSEINVTITMLWDGGFD